MKKVYIMIYLSIFTCTFQLQAKDFHVSETYKNEGGKKPECWKPDDNNTKR